MRARSKGKIYELIYRVCSRHASAYEVQNNSQKSLAVASLYCGLLIFPGLVKPNPTNHHLVTTKLRVNHGSLKKLKEMPKN